MFCNLQYCNVTFQRPQSKEDLPLAEFKWRAWEIWGHTCTDIECSNYHPFKASRADVSLSLERRAQRCDQTWKFRTRSVPRFHTIHIAKLFPFMKEQTQNLFFKNANVDFGRFKFFAVRWHPESWIHNEPKMKNGASCRWRARKDEICIIFAGCVARYERW